MGIKFTNNAYSTLAGDIASGALTLSVAASDGAKFPVAGAGNYFRVTLMQSTNMEIVKVTARTGDTFSTIVRGEEGTAPLAFTTGANVSLYLTNQDLVDLANERQAPITVSGMLKGTGSAVVTATAGTDYLAPPSGTAIQKASNGGALANAVLGTDYAPATSGATLLKGNGVGGFAAAIAGTDYPPATTGTAILKGDGAGAFANAVAETDYVAPSTLASYMPRSAGSSAPFTGGVTSTFYPWPYSATERPYDAYSQWIGGRIDSVRFAGFGVYSDTKGLFIVGTEGIDIWGQSNGTPQVILRGAGATINIFTTANNGLAVRGSTYPTTGKGLEFLFRADLANAGLIQSYNRDTPGYNPLVYSSSDHRWLCSGVQVAMLESDASFSIGDVYSHRTGTTGAYFFGTKPIGNFFYFNGSNYELSGGHLNDYGSLILGGQNGGGAAAHAVFDCRVAADLSFCMYQSAGVYFIMGAHNIAATTYKDTHFVANLHVGPFTDNAISCGYGSNRWNNVYSTNGTINTSDGRLKTEVRDSTLGLKFIEALRPVSYKWIVGGNRATLEEDGTEEEPGYTTVEGEEIPPKTKPKYKNTITEIPGKRTHWGLVSQDVRAALTALGVEDFAGYVLDDKDDPDSTQSLRYHEFIGPMIKAIQELSAKVKKLEAQLGV